MVSLCVLVGGSAFAQQGGIWDPAPFPDQPIGQRFAVIAYSDITGNFGYSYDFPNLNMATQAAVNACGFAGCRPTVWTTACATLAQSWDRRFVAPAWALSRRDSERSAVQSCEFTTGHGCRVLVSVCNRGFR